jgi:catechol 2,3-dioxygenase-like lactoylglutathione lyase family enzyme
MMISGLHHASIVVSDMKKSLTFYRDTLGMKQEMEFRYEADPVVMDLPGSKPKQHLILLSAGNALRLPPVARADCSMVSRISKECPSDRGRPLRPGGAGATDPRPGSPADPRESARTPRA